MGIGKPKHKIIWYYVTYYLKVMVPVGMIGVFGGYGAAMLFSRWILETNIARQHDFIHEYTYRINDAVELLHIEPMTAFKIGILTLLAIVVCMSICITMTTGTILFGKLREEIRGR